VIAAPLVPVAPEALPVNASGVSCALSFRLTLM
jgi:hypothetical protein